MQQPDKNSMFSFRSLSANLEQIENNIKESVMSERRYIMHDQTRAKIQDIMREHPSDAPRITHPGWLAVTLLVVAVNVMAVLPPSP